MSVVLKIKKRHPVRRTERFRFEGVGLRVIKIGRLRSAHVPLEEAGASRLQAVIRLQKGRAMLQNIGHGELHLNDQQQSVGQPTELFSGDVLRIGSTELGVSLRALGPESKVTEIRKDLAHALQGAGDTTYSQILSFLSCRRSASNETAPTPEELPRSSRSLGLDDCLPEPSGEGESMLGQETERRAEKYDTDFLVGRFQSEQRARRRAWVGVFCLITGLGIFTTLDESPASKVGLQRLAETEVEQVLEAPKPKPTFHTVVRGETLGTLALEYFGESKLWRKLWNANRSRLSDPSALEPGMRLRIPERPELP